VARRGAAGHTGGPASTRVTMLALFHSVGWRESLLIVAIASVFLGLKLRKALYKR
jgi:hypothetical protein